MYDSDIKAKDGRSHGRIKCHLSTCSSIEYRVSWVRWTGQQVECGESGVEYLRHNSFSMVDLLTHSSFHIQNPRQGTRSRWDIIQTRCM